MVCLPSLKQRLGNSLSCWFSEYAGNQRNLICWFRKLKNTYFSRKIKTLNWYITRVFQTSIPCVSIVGLLYFFLHSAAYIENRSNCILFSPPPCISVEFSNFCHVVCVFYIVNIDTGGWGEGHFWPLILSPIVVLG